MGLWRLFSLRGTFLSFGIALEVLSTWSIIGFWVALLGVIVFYTLWIPRKSQSAGNTGSWTTV
jgi:hypothetical protein